MGTTEHEEPRFFFILNKGAKSGGEITHAVLNGSIVSKPAGWDAFHGLALAREKLSSKFILHKLFGNIVYRAEFHAFHGGINFGVVGHNDEGLHLSLLSHPAQKVYATAVRQTQVGNHDIIICCLLQMFLRG